jgi:hypothetical protein
MHKHATIFIPDISGYTELCSHTELDFSSGVLCELLNELIGVAKDEFKVAEIEGDAILFYVKGKKLPARELISYCVEAYHHFHKYLKALVARIEDENTRKHVEQLTVKFIIHWGPIAEMNIANFSKPVGLALIKAHKLLKNSIPSKAYILMTEEYLEEQTAEDWKMTGHHHLHWLEGEEEYPILGKVRYSYALLGPGVVMGG